MATARPRPISRRTTYRVAYDFASVSADTTTKIAAVKLRSVRVERVWLSVPVGVVADATNFVTFKILKGSTVVASWATSVAGQGTITAATPVEMVLSATVANRFLADADILSVFVDVNGTITVPLGRVVVEGTEL